MLGKHMERIVHLINISMMFCIIKTVLQALINHTSSNKKRERGNENFIGRKRDNIKVNANNILCYCKNSFARWCKPWRYMAISIGMQGPRFATEGLCLATRSKIANWQHRTGMRKKKYTYHISFYWCHTYPILQA